MTNNLISTVIEVGGQKLTLTNEENVVVVTTASGKQFFADAWNEGCEPESETDLKRMLWDVCGCISEGDEYQDKFDDWYEYCGYPGYMSRKEARKEFDRSCRLAREWKEATGIAAETLMEDFFNKYDF